MWGAPFLTEAIIGYNDLIYITLPPPRGRPPRWPISVTLVCLKNSCLEDLRRPPSCRLPRRPFYHSRRRPDHIAATSPSRACSVCCVIHVAPSPMAKRSTSPFVKGFQICFAHDSVMTTESTRPHQAPAIACIPCVQKRVHEILPVPAQALLEPIRYRRLQCCAADASFSRPIRRFSAS